MTKRSLAVSIGALLLLVITSATAWFVYRQEEGRSNVVAAKAREQDQLDKFDDLRKRWVDAIRLAASTPREQLSGPIAKLQEIRREADSIYFLCNPINGLGTYRAGMDRGIDTMLHHMREGKGGFDEASLDWMEERLSLANKQLAKACGI